MCFLLSPVTLRRIDLTGNVISEIEDGAFSKLTLLEELSLAENRLVKLPMLPAKLTTFNANYNLLRTKGVKATAFKVHIFTFPTSQINTVCYTLPFIKTVPFYPNVNKKLKEQMNE